MKTSKFDPFIKRTNVRNIKLLFKIFNIIFRIGEVIYPKALADFVRKKFFTPVPNPLTKPQQAWIRDASLFSVSSRGRQLSAWKIGEGPSILFVHGWNGRGVQFQRFFQPLLDYGFSVIFYDAPAHGLSEGEITNYLEVSESLSAIFSHTFGKDIAGVVAHSLGASAIVNHMSRHHSDIPLVLVAPALQLMELLFTNFQQHGVPKKTYLKLVKEVEDDFQIPLETQNPVDLIHALKNDVLIIHDEADRTTPIDPSRHVANEIFNVNLIETNGYGHSKLLRKKFVIEQTMKFLRKHQKAKKTSVLIA